MEPIPAATIAQLVGSVALEAMMVAVSISLWKAWYHSRLTDLSIHWISNV
jgi:hypothetical protein